MLLPLTIIYPFSGPCREIEMLCAHGFPWRAMLSLCMLETLIVLYILLAFIFPFHSLVISLGAGTAWLIYRGNFLLKNQPLKGKPIIWISLLATAVNFFMSALVGVGMASLVYFFILGNYYLFLFNFLFCAAISLRWFDFAYKLYQAQILKLIKSPPASAAFFEADDENVTSQPLFAVCMGLSKKTGLGGGMVPMFIDSGYLYVKEGKLFFDGIFFRHLFDANSVMDAEKVSSEKIRIFANPGEKPFKADAFLLILRRRFYPFKSRASRDKIFNVLSASLENCHEGVPS